MVKELSVVGKRLPRPDVISKATGAAKYTGDMKLPGMLTGKVLRSPYPHAKILRIDTSKAEKLTGVEAVITSEDMPRKPFGSSLPYLKLAPERAKAAVRDERVISDKARFVGDAIAAVAAVNEEIAEEALGLIEVEYEELPAVFDAEEAVKPGAPRIHDFAEGNIAARVSFPFAQGDVQKGFREADHVVEETFRTTKQKHCQLEPSACIASFDDTGRLTVWSHHQQLHYARRGIAELFDLPVGMVRWISPPIGGAFGLRINFSIQPICVALSLKAGKPVKMEYTTEEEFTTTGTRQPTVQTGKMGVNKDGTIVALQTPKGLVSAGAYLSQAGSTTATFISKFMALYRCRNTAGEVDIVYTNTSRTDAFRGYGNLRGMFILEQLVDMAAESIGMDPVDFRLKNHRQAGEPSWLPSQPIESCALSECIKTGAEKIGWKKKRARKESGVRKRGVGMATALHVSGGHPFTLEHSSVLVKFNEDGSASLVVSPGELGQGILGTVAQITAEELGIHYEDIHIVTGDTDTTLFDVGAHASCQLYVIGNAALGAARDARGKLLQRAAQTLEVSAEELDTKDGQVFVKANPEKQVSIAEVVTDAMYNFQGDCLHIVGSSTFSPTRQSPPYQAVFIDLEVDTETGEVKLLKVVAANDCGRAINPTTVEGQIEGGIVQGIGYTLTEDYLINKDTGVLESDNFATYKIPSTLDLPEIEVILVEQPDPAGPFGGKGVGELGPLGIAPAIANAIYNAVGVRITELPITPEKVLSGLKAK